MNLILVEKLATVLIHLALDYFRLLEQPSLETFNDSSIWKFS